MAARPPPHDLAQFNPRRDPGPQDTQAYTMPLNPCPQLLALHPPPRPPALYCFPFLFAALRLPTSSPGRRLCGPQVLATRLMASVALRVMTNSEGRPAPMSPATWARASSYAWGRECPMRQAECPG